MKTGALILAAGLSSRMGQFKPLLPLGAETILRLGLKTLLKADVSPIVVVTGREASLLEMSIKDLGVECIHNPDFATTQMLDSARIGMKALKGRCDRFFFSPGDVCAYKAETLLRMKEENTGVLRPLYNGKSGHPILIDAGLIDTFLTTETDSGLKGLIDLVEDKKDIEVDDEGILYDADTIEDYKRLKKYVGDIR